MKVPELRNGNDGSGEPKEVESTKMLNTVARETVDYDEANDNKERVTTHPSFGALGMTGRE